MSCIKSVQRGTTNVSYNGTSITITEIDPMKTIVLLNGNAWDYASGTYTSSSNLPYLKSLTATVLTIACNKYNDFFSATVSWQVIEFV